MACPYLRRLGDADQAGGRREVPKLLFRRTLLQPCIQLRESVSEILHATTVTVHQDVSSMRSIPERERGRSQDRARRPVS
jgi:hypothetical protein